MTVTLSGLARQDLDDIRAYTVETWGRTQWLTYYRGLADVFERIAADPTTGRDRRLFVEGMRSVDFKSHVVFFKPLKIADGMPVVLRIAHRHRNLPALTYYDGLDAP